MRWKFEREDLEIYKCCFCCHVRTGTLILGIFDLLGHIAGLSLFVVALTHPELIDTLLPQAPTFLTPTPFAREASTPLPPLLPGEHKAETPRIAIGFGSNDSVKLLGDPFANRENLQTLVYVRNWNTESLILAMLLTVASMVIALGLIYGTIRGVSKYITPFFCVQMFDLCLSGLTMLSYFSDLNSVRSWIAAQNKLPFKEQLLALDNDHLTLLTLIIFVAALSIKAYFIGVVWSCYKYLKLHEAMGGVGGGAQGGRVRIYDSEEARMGGCPEDTQMLLPPKYEDVPLIAEPENRAPPPAYTPA